MTSTSHTRAVAEDREFYDSLYDIDSDDSDRHGPGHDCVRCQS